MGYLRKGTGTSENRRLCTETAGRAVNKQELGDCYSLEPLARSWLRDACPAASLPGRCQWALDGPRWGTRLESWLEGGAQERVQERRLSAASVEQARAVLTLVVSPPSLT